MEKYYDLIISLIKENRKYPECEGIIDEIVSDVHEHAKIVLETVTDESIIESYLRKIVSTSMITVPRRLGVKPSSQKFNVSENILKTVQQADEERELEEELEESGIETDEIDVSEPIADEFESELKLVETDNVEDDSPELIEEEESVFEISGEEPLILAEKEETEDEEEAQEEEEVVPAVDKNLVDRMINGISQEDNQEIEEDSSFSHEDTEIEETEIQSDSDEELSSELFEEELPVEDILEEETESVIEEIPDFEEDLSEISEGEIQEVDEVAVEDFEDESESEEIEETKTQNEKETEEFSYDCFDFIPREVEPEYEPDEIVKKINDIQSKYEDKPIIEVFKLKYKENLSIDEISEKLGISDESILEILNEFIYIVKD